MEANMTKESDTYEDVSSTFNYILHVLFLILVCVISLLGITGNGLVIWFVAFRMKKTVNSVWFLSLAVADFTFSLYLAFLFVSLAIGFFLSFETFICFLSILIIHLNASVSIFQLTVISIDRYICVVYPVWCRNHRTVRLAVKVVLAIWIVSLLLNFFYLLVKYKSGFNERMTCLVEQSVQKTDVLLIFIVIFVLPFTVIISCNLVIVSRIRRSQRSTSSKPVKVITAVIISFFICWFPFHLFYLVRLYDDFNTLYTNPWFLTGLTISYVLVYSNSCINPLLYVFIGQNFKEKFWKSIKSGFGRAFAEDTNLRDSETPRTDPRFIATQAVTQM